MFLILTWSDSVFQVFLAIKIMSNFLSLEGAFVLNPSLKWLFLVNKTHKTKPTQEQGDLHPQIVSMLTTILLCKLSIIILISSH